ncbi:Scr1 family TA system antitoxin-like transcriptional regulator [Streptomyces sp. C8S0]|uniref:Scr1 family TA system antitoxin-like transcriptional regulator n=1 Tax=Streptomyces sp. C8S0 TaxID=2585716 RepID=UPI00125D516E|nr:Scr1 family TA system antitoxin-like transcriptional regulator [Streptomyces sp. C8S0]
MPKHRSVYDLVTALSREAVARDRHANRADDDPNDEMLADTRVCVDYSAYQAVRQIACEDAAVRWLAYGSRVIPRRFQTEAYAAAVNSGTLPSGTSRELPTPRGGKCWPTLLLDRLVLHRVLGSPATMKDQLCHLQNLVDHGRAAVRIVDGVPVGTLTELYYGPSVLYVSEDIEMTVYRMGTYESTILGFDLTELVEGALPEDDSYKLLEEARSNLLGARLGQGDTAMTTW